MGRRALSSGLRWLCPMAAVLGVAACELPAEATPPPDDEDEPVPVQVRNQAATGVTGDDGTVAITVDVQEGETAFLLTALATDFVGLDRIVDPTGAVVFVWDDTARGFTAATLATSTLTNVNWPVSDTDPPLSAGAYTVVLYVEESRTSALKPDVLVDTATLTKTDSDLRRGQLRAHIIFAAGVADDQEAVTGIEAALVRWQRVYAEVGIDLRTRTSSSDITAELETPAFNNDAVAAASQLSDGSELTVLLGESLPGGLIGYSGGLPGGFFPSGTSAIVVSWLAASGPDARFSEDEIDSLGDVLAHEAGHYLGLFHPFAIYGESSPFRSWDAIDDTVECTTTNECEAALATNLMFPYVVTDDAGQIVEHHEVTPAQRSVLHRYGGMR